jgi:hypothetical protein
VAISSGAQNRDLTDTQETRASTSNDGGEA